MRQYRVAPTSWKLHTTRHHYVSHGKFVTPIETAAAATSTLIARRTTAQENYEAGWDRIIELGNEQIAGGNMNITASMYMKAMADKAAYVGKKQNRQLEAAKTMYAFMTAKTDSAERSTT